MTGRELLADFILTINHYLGFDDDGVENTVIIDENLNSALAQLKALAPPANFVILIDALDKLIETNADNFLANNYLVTGTIQIIDFADPNLDKKNRAFAYSDSDFGFFSTKSLIQSGALVDISLPQFEILWKQMQEFLERCYTIPDADKITILLDCISLNNINTGFVINKQSMAGFDSNRHFSYIYLSYLNNSKAIDLPPELIYSSPVLNNSLILDNTKIYEQYFDIYDVINELNQTPDILSRFLRLYHILEYLVYRVYLVDLTNRVGTNKFFVREFASSSESMVKNEKKSFTKNFPKIFHGDIARLNADLLPHSTTPVKDFLRDRAIVKGFVPSNLERIAELIYGLRCCIVHNKESEYHLTISNNDDYSLIVPLIRQLIQTLEYLIIGKIANNYNIINYPQQHLNLY
ncbi:MAG TPA: hypothetical protein VE978_13265 [Chitinophagales bacterium]|nr:hypothetical protein [Chitinophagales bacterium]